MRFGLFHFSLLMAVSFVLAAWNSANADEVPCTPTAGFDACVRVTHEGANQTFTVPDGVDELDVKLWGAGGGGSTNGSSGRGGGGGFTQGTLPVTGGSALNVIVGGGGNFGGRFATVGTAFGGGGAGGADAFSSFVGGSGGGRSAIEVGGTPFLVAGGGGGSAGATAANGGTANAQSFAGAGGQDAGFFLGCIGGTAATAGTLTAGGAGGVGNQSGTDGSSGQGGTGGASGNVNSGAGGGGGGFFGGGGGNGQSVATGCGAGINPALGQEASGAGGSGFLGSVVTNGSIVAGNREVPAATTDVHYLNTTAAGGIGGQSGSNGSVIIQWTEAPTTDPGGPSGVCPFVTGFDGLTPEYDSTPYYALGQNLNGQHVANTGAIPSDASGSGLFLFHNTFNAPGGQTVNGESWGTVTPASVEPNTNYVFTFQMANQNGINRQIIQPQINGVNVGGTFTTTSTQVWEVFEVIWNSGSATTADLSLVQTRGGTSGGGLDWGFDEISLCPALDQSDAPDSFQTAAHVIVADFRLGAAIDAELAGGSADASGDGADDDGVTIPTLTQGQTATITADVTGAGGFLQGWIDFDGSGTFEAGEQIATDLQDNGTGDDAATNDGTITFDVAVPSDAVITPTFARFRWSTISGLDASSAASDGEVEDYAVTISDQRGSLTPFVCTGDFFQIHDNPSAVSRVDLATGQFETLGNTGQSLRATGFDTDTRLAYSIQQNTNILFAVGANA
ncbi:MAG: GEVED domain-containing protein, partial [Hyphomonadaceae bacterium]